MRKCTRFALLLVLLALPLFGGCPGGTVQANKFTAFKDAGAALNTQTRASYDEALTLLSLLHTQCLVAPINATAYENGLVKGDGASDPCNAAIKKPYPDPTARFDVRLKALKAFAQYTTQVSALATTDYVAEANVSAAKLEASMGSLGQALEDAGAKGLTTATANKDVPGLIKKAVQKAAALYIEQKRKEALRTILAEAQPHIDQLAEALTSDQLEVSNLVGSYWEGYAQLVAGARPPQKERDKLLAYTAAALEVKKRVDAVQNALKAQEDALRKLPKANMELLQSLDETKPTPLEALEAFAAAAGDALYFASKLRNH